MTPEIRGVTYTVAQQVGIRIGSRLNRLWVDAEQNEVVSGKPFHMVLQVRHVLERSERQGKSWFERRLSGTLFTRGGLLGVYPNSHIG